MRILVAITNISFVEQLSDVLAQNGFAVDVAGGPDDVLARLDVVVYDLLLLELGFLDQAGDDVLSEIRRAAGDTPILVLLEDQNAQQHSLIVSHDLNGPTHETVTPATLLTHMVATLSLPRRAVASTVRVANVMLDTVAITVRIDNVEIHLSRRMFAVLLLLMRTPDQPVSRERLEHTLFSFDRHVTPNALEVAISRLRSKLRQHGAGFSVVAQHLVGYCLLPTAPPGKSRAGSADERHPPSNALVNLPQQAPPPERPP